MPSIELKPNSPEYDDGMQEKNVRKCDIDHCHEEGAYKAPKSRGLDAYFYFCLDHVREYNKGWNFFAGMAAREVEEHMLRSIYGDRPTWRNDHGPHINEQVYRKAWQAYHYSEGEPPQGDSAYTSAGGMAYHHDSPEYKAMALFELQPPLSMEIIKKRYKELVKKHHPDHNPDCEMSEELLKDVNIAYTVLKTAYEKYERFEKLKKNG